MSITVLYAHKNQHDLTLPYLIFGVGAEHSSAEASVWAQCATPTDLMVEGIS